MTKVERNWLTEELVSRAEQQIISEAKRIEFYITEYSVDWPQKWIKGIFLFQVPKSIYMGTRAKVTIRESI